MYVCTYCVTAVVGLSELSYKRVTATSWRLLLERPLWFPIHCCTYRIVATLKKPVGNFLKMMLYSSTKTLSRLLCRAFARTVVEL